MIRKAPNIPVLIASTLCLYLWGFQASAQSRKAVSGAEVNGTFRMHFTGKYKAYFNEIKIWALGNNKLEVNFDLLYPHEDSTGRFVPNIGNLGGIAMLTGDTAAFKTNDEVGTCHITIKFVRPGLIQVTQSTIGDCGFGHNVTADGSYKKTSGAKPKFPMPDD